MINAKKLMARMMQQTRSGAEWTNINPILMAGELGIEKDTYRVKVGDGIHTWTELPYWTTNGKTYSSGTGVTVTDHVISADLQYEII